MRVLFLSLYPPSPPVDGGRIRTLNVLKQVAGNHEVTLLCFDDPFSSLSHHNLLRSFCVDVFIVASPENRKRGLVRKVVDFFSISPIGLKQWHSGDMSKAIAKEISLHAYDIIHIDHILLAQYYSVFRNIRWILTHHNIESLSQRRLQDLAGSTNLARRILSRIETYRWQQYEINISKKASAIITVSEVEARYFRRHHANNRVIVVPNGVDLEYFHADTIPPDSPVILFTGRMDYQPNIDGVRWFCAEILPIIQHRIPEIQFVIVGRNPPRDVQELEATPGIQVTSTVEDMRGYYGNATVFVVPLRSGAGTRLKILEAMAMHVPVVSTSIGCEGLDFKVDQEILVSDDPDQFAGKVIDLVLSPAARSRLTKTAYERIEQTYDWKLTVKPLEIAYSLP